MATSEGGTGAAGSVGSTGSGPFVVATLFGVPGSTGVPGTISATVQRFQ